MADQNEIPLNLLQIIYNLYSMKLDNLIVVS